MHVSELRIGNHTDRGIVHSIQSKDPRADKFWSNKELVTLIDGGLVTVLAEYLNPVPLTEEKLLKFGFSDEDYKEGYIGIEVKSNMIIDFVLTKPYVRGEWQSCYIFELGNHRFVKLKNVHDLQNPFYSLHKQELTLKN